MRANMNLTPSQGSFCTSLNASHNQGTKWSGGGFNFEIVDMDGHRIDKVLVMISGK
jgi:CBS domain containing-hemolysin-like protein